MHLTPRVSAAILILFALAASPARAGKPGIVYDAGTFEGRRVFTARPNGRKVKVRARDLLRDAFLLGPSPNGRCVAWKSLAAGAGGTGDFVLAKTRGGKERSATESLDGAPLAHAWSPDSRWFYFEVRDPGTGRSDVYRANRKGKKRSRLTEDLSGTASADPGPTRIRVSPDGRWVAFLWEFPGRRGLVVLDPDDETSVRDVTAGLPEGAPTGGFDMQPGNPGLLTFLYRWEGEELSRLMSWSPGDLHPVSREALVISYQAVPGAGAAHVRTTSGDRIQGSGEADTIHTDGAIERYRLADDGRVLAAVRTAAGLEIRDRSPDPRFGEIDLDEVEDIRDFRRGWVVRVVSGGERRLLVSVDGREYEPAAGLGGRLGAFAAGTPDGEYVLFQRIEEDSSNGSLLACSTETGEITDLTAATGIPGLPGEARFSARSPDVLFATVTEPSFAKRLFLWRPRRRRIVVISPESELVGSFQFAR